MDINNYLARAELIRKSEIWSAAELCRQLNIKFNTWKRIHNEPEKCALMTMRKLKIFVEAWEYKNRNMSCAD